MAGLLDVKRLQGLLDKLDAQDYNPNDSFFASIINNPAGLVTKWLPRQVNTAAGIPDQYDNPTPWIAPSVDEQISAANNVAGIAQLGAFPMAPKSSGGTLGTFIGPKASTWDTDKAAAAAKMLDDGVDPAQVWNQHLIGRMPDGKLFSEIDDSGAYIKNNRLIHDILDSNYNSLSSRVKFNQELPYGVNGERDLHGIDVSENAKNPLSTAMHEIGHDVQALEGWQSGGSEGYFPNKESLKKGKIIAKLKERGLDDEGVDKFFRQNLNQARLNNYPDKSRKVSAAILGGLEQKKYYQSLSPEPYQNYRRLTGEAQARATQDRLNMNLDERRANYPLAGGMLSDIPLDQLIYRYGDNGPAMAIDENLNKPLLENYLQTGKLSPQELAQYETNAVQMTDSGKHHYNLANANAQGGTPESRAVDLGFDTPVYHGTGSGDLIGNELVPGGANGAKQTGDAYGLGVYTSTSPNTANSYTRGESPAVFPLMVNRQNYLNIDYPTQNDYEKLSKYAGEVMLPSDKARFEGGKAIKEFEDLQSARDFFAERRKDWEQFGGGYDRARPEAILGDDGIPKVQYTDFFGDVPITNPDDAFTLMRATGWDNIPSMGYEGHTMLRNKSEDWDITRNTKNLRSRFAAFDPLRKDSSNLLASLLLPSTILGYGLLADQKNNKSLLY